MIDPCTVGGMSSCGRGLRGPRGGGAAAGRTAVPRQRPTAVAGVVPVPAVVRRDGPPGDRQQRLLGGRQRRRARVGRIAAGTTAKRPGKDGGEPGGGGCNTAHRYHYCNNLFNTKERREEDRDGMGCGLTEAQGNMHEVLARITLLEGDTFELIPRLARGRYS